MENGFTSDERKIRILQLITVSAVIFFVLIMAGLIMNLVKLSSLRTKEAMLAAELTALEAVIADNDEDIAYRSTDEYVERYAREELNMKRKDESGVFQAKK